MHTFLQDLRFGARALSRNTGFVTASVLTLALGIGANTAMFSVVNALLIRELPYPDVGRIVRVYDVNQEQGVKQGEFSPQDFDDLKRESIFRSLASYQFVPGLTGKNLVGIGEPQQLQTAYVSGDFFNIMGVPAALGRALVPSDDAVGNDHSVVVSHGFWRNQLGSDPNAVGRIFSLGDQPFTIVGVMPADFQFPSSEVQAWTPISLMTDKEVPHKRFIRWMSVVGLIKPEQSILTAQMATSAFLSQLEKQYGDSNAGWGAASVVSLKDSIVGGVRTVLLILLTAVALVLLIACANIANLLLVRGSSRGREMAIRSALGADSKRLVRQLMTESLLLAVSGAIIGLLVAKWGIYLANQWSSGTILQNHPISIDYHVVSFCLVASLVTWPVFGLAPALSLIRGTLNDSMKSGGMDSTGGHTKSSWREHLVIAEIAAAVVLVVSSGLALKSLWRLIHVDPGFNPQHVLSLRLTIPDAKTSDIARLTVYRNQVMESIASVPGVVAVGGSKTLPLDGGGEPYNFTIGAPQGSVKVVPRAGAYIVTPGYFRALAIPLVSGRTFSGGDLGTKYEVVVDQALSRQYWANQNPVGQKVYIGNTALEVIGVVGDVHTEGLAKSPRSAMYVPANLFPRSRLNLFVRTSGDPLQIARAVRQAIWNIDKNQPISDIAALEDIVNAHTSEPRFFAALLGGFGGLALLLAAVGTYGVIAYTVRQQTREFGLRMALGAQRMDVLILVLRRSLRMAVVGLAIGIMVSLVSTRLLSGFLFGISATDPATFVATSLVLGSMALLASYIPARWATKIDPLVALRYE